MSLRHLPTGNGAQFFRPNPRRRLRKSAAAEIVRTASATRTVQDKKIRESLTVDGSVVHITYVCFPVESEPTFLAGSGLEKTAYSYLLLIEASDTITVLKHNVEGLMQALSRFVLPWKHEELGGVYAANNPAFEKISLRAMSVAANVVKRRSLEADNLAESMAVVGVHRFKSHGFRVRGSELTHNLRKRPSLRATTHSRRPKELSRRVMRTVPETKGDVGKK